MTAVHSARGGGKGGALAAQTRSEQLDSEILDATSELVGRLIAHAERISQQLAVPSFFIKVLHMLDCPMAMKELGRRMHCDPSFVTIVADTLEKRGLARREPHPGDRRVKTLILTAAGLAMKQRLESEVAACMPWRRALSESEREQLLALIQKMIKADIAACGMPDDHESAEQAAARAGTPETGTAPDSRPGAMSTAPMAGITTTTKVPGEADGT
jgi:MarR family transcriptional regulator, organic hydroperoxide resistance regulator